MRYERITEVFKVVERLHRKRTNVGDVYSNFVSSKSVYMQSNLLFNKQF